MSIDYLGLVKRAGEITWRYKFLWLLAVLAIFTEGVGSNAYISIPSSPTSTIAPEATPSPEPADYERNLSIEAKYSRLKQEFLSSGLVRAAEDTASYNTAVALALLTLTLSGSLLLILLLYVSYSAKAGLIIAVGKIETDHPPTFAEAFHLGRRFGWRLFGFYLLLGIAFVVLVGILAAPIITLIILAGGNVGVTVLAVLVGLGVLLIVVVAVLYLSVLLRVIEREIVLADRGFIKAFQAAHRLLWRFPGQYLIIWLIAFGISLIAALAVFLPVLLVGIVLFGLGVVAYLSANVVGAIVFAIPAALALLALMIFARALGFTFESTYWTLGYRALHGASK